MPLIACLAHLGRHNLLLDSITTTLWHVITTLSLYSKGLVLHIVAIEAAVLHVLWIGLTLSWLANHVHADMLTLPVNIVLVG